MENRDIHYVYRLKRKDISTVVSIGSGDLNILKAYKGHLNIPMRSVLHEMIGTAAKCWEEKHDQTIKDMHESIRVQAKIIVAYIQKYGPVSKSVVQKVIKEEKAEEKGKSADKDALSEQ